MIETKRLVLRDWREGDDLLLHRHCNTRNVMRWLGGVQSSERMTEIVHSLARLQEEHGHTFWVVERRSDRAFIGFCGLKRANGSNSKVAGEIEIGWRLREDAWGRGYAKEGAIASLDFAFDRLKAKRVVAVTIEGNEASWGLMLRLGMSHRPDLDYFDPEWPDEMNPMLVYEIQPLQWRSPCPEEAAAIGAHIS